MMISRREHATLEVGWAVDSLVRASRFWICKRFLQYCSKRFFRDHQDFLEISKTPYLSYSFFGDKKKTVAIIFLKVMLAWDMICFSKIAKQPNSVVGAF